MKFYFYQSKLNYCLSK